MKETKDRNIIFGYKFGLEFLNSRNGRKFLGSLKKEITFGDYKFFDIPNTCSSAVRAIRDLNFNYPTWSANENEIGQNIIDKSKINHLKNKYLNIRKNETTGLNLNMKL